MRQPLAAFTLLLASACGGGTADPGVVIPLEPGAGATSPALLPALDVQQAPAGNFDLSRWKLTLPSGAEVSAAVLADGYQLAGAFFTDPLDGGMVFRCPNLAGTTANSSYSRSELREMLAPDGSAKADANNWTTATGGTLRATLRVDHVSTTGDAGKRGRVVIGQIHGDDSEVVRLYYHKAPEAPTGRIYAGLDSADNVNSWSPDIIGTAQGGIALGEIFDYEIRLAATTLTVTVVPPSGPAAVYVKDIDPAYAGENLYFKAGVYNQNNTGEASDYVQATFLALTHTHP